MLRALSTTLIGGAAASIDRAVVRAIQTRNRRAESTATVLTHERRMDRLAQIRAEYDAPRFIDRPNDFFAPPVAVTPRLVDVRRGVIDASWSSASVPFAESVRAAYVAHEANRTAHARLYVGDSGKARPAVIVVHGYLSGSWAIEERAWPIEWMRRQGFDVAVIVLPFHALRGSAGPPPFPGPDPRFTNEGFRQAIADLRVLREVLLARGASSVGVMGMSLGGYTSSLFGTLEPELSFVVPIIPLASLADFARDQGRLGTGENGALQHRALEDANWVVSPLARKLAVDPKRVLVVGAESDRITPIAHAERLATHFSAPLLRVGGGHLMQLWRREAFRATKALWRELGLVP